MICKFKFAEEYKVLSERSRRISITRAKIRAVTSKFSKLGKSKNILDKKEN
jgi:hypothetical protein